MADRPGHNSNPQQAPIRFGILCRGREFSAWEALCLDSLLTLDNVWLTLVIVDDRMPTVPLGLRSGYRHALFNLYTRLMRSRALRKVDMAEVFSKVQVLNCPGIADADACDPDVADRIRDCGLDFILLLGEGKGNAPAECMQYGVWTFRHGNSGSVCTTVPGFWEIYNGDAVTEAALIRLCGGSTLPTVLKTGALKTVSHSWSGNLDSVLFEVAEWPAQACRNLRNIGIDRMGMITSDVYSGSSVPSDLKILGLMGRIISNCMSKINNRLLFHKQWSIGVVHQPIHEFLKQDTEPEVCWMPQSGNGTFHADPFGIFRDGQMSILCEEFSQSSGKGVIINVSLDEPVASSQTRTAIDLPHHLSYPYILEHDGEVYCIPEAFESREISLYRAVEFPGRWSKTAALVSDVAAVDSTVFRHDGLWWLMFTDQDKGPNHKLYVWYAPDLFGPWQPHQANPVKVDVRSSRPAGTPFVHEGFLYRPAQDCSKVYGGRVVINRVLKLTPFEFLEKESAVVEPFANSPYKDGMHTISAVGDITLVDGHRYVFDRGALKSAFINGIRALKPSLGYSRTAQALEKTRLNKADRPPEASS